MPLPTFTTPPLEDDPDLIAFLMWLYTETAHRQQVDMWHNAVAAAAASASTDPLPLL